MTKTCTAEGNAVVSGTLASYKSVYSTISATDSEELLDTQDTRLFGTMFRVLLEIEPDASTGMELFMQGVSFKEYLSLRAVCSFDPTLLPQRRPQACMLFTRVLRFGFFKPDCVALEIAA